MTFRLAALLAAFASPAAAADLDPERFEKEVLVPACADPMQLDVLADGRVVFIERAGPVKLFDPATKRVTTLGAIPVEVYGEVGLLGLAADPDYARTGHLFLFFCPKGRRTTLRLARFTACDGTLPLNTEAVLFEYPIDEAGNNHQGGGLAWGPDGCLVLGTGDNSPPIPELPVDQRPGRENFDALRTSANSNDLRGKILRVRPRPEGGYDIPAGNLFPGGTGGRPEIFAMGCRNAFRSSVDPKTGWVYWGDVGPNVAPDPALGPNGYDEFNQARRAGNFGWPMFVGPNEAYRDFDFATRTVGTVFDAKRPANRSRNNTGATDLPPPVPALIWYPSGESDRFPGLGTGGRSAMAGPVVRDRPGFDPVLKMPAEYDGCLLAFDWMRNWVKVVRFDANGDLAGVEPFAPGLTFRRPIDLKLGPDGTLYAIEYGDQWAGNTDSQVVRVVYRRGNRPPTAVASADPPAGRHPLTVGLDGTKSSDKDGGPLAYEWRVGDEIAPRATGPTAAVTFDRPGGYRVRLTVRDAHGASGTTETVVHVGNAPPAVRFAEPIDGTFFDWGEPLLYRVEVEDAEDGATATGRVAPARVTVRGDLRARAGGADDDPALTLMRRANCFGCHAADAPTGGPAYAAVAARYKGDPAATDRLAAKVLAGGGGVWGPHAMPAQSHLTPDQARAAVGWVLGLADRPPPAQAVGAAGVLTAPPAPRGGDDLSRRWAVTAAFTDGGAAGAPPLTAEAAVTLLSRRQRAAFGESITGGEVVDVFEGGEKTVVRLARGGRVGFGRVDLAGIDRLTVRAGETAGGEVEFYSGGRPLARVAVPAGAGFRNFDVSLPPAAGPAGPLVAVATAPLTLAWVEFHDGPAARAERAARTAAARDELKARAEMSRPRSFVRRWTVDELAPRLAAAGAGRSLDRGWAAFRAAGCVACHRLGGLGGDAGPDLSHVGKRMAAQPDPRHALLRELVEPSRVVAEAYRPVTVTTLDGRQVTGTLVGQDGAAVRLRLLPPAPPDVTAIPRADIDGIARSDQSPMPAGLLDVLTEAEILDLIALIETGGDPRHPAFTPPRTNR
jgi:cytochrome c